MDKPQIFQILQSQTGKMSDDLQRDWGLRSKVVKAKKGEIIVHEGERTPKVWFIAAGTVRASYLKEGKRICDWLGFKGDFICSLSSFYSGSPSFHQLDLLSDSILLETTKTDTDELCELHHEMERLGRLSTTASLMQLHEKMVSIQFETARNRLDTLLEKHPNIYQLVPLGDIASYIGIAPETLSRIRAGKCSST